MTDPNARKSVRVTVSYSGWSTSTENGAGIVGAHTLIIRKTTSDCLGQPASDQVTQEANGEILTTSYPGWIILSYCVIESFLSI